MDNTTAPARNSRSRSNSRRSTVGAPKNDRKSFRPKSFKEFWDFAIANLQRACTDPKTKFLDKERFTRRRRELKPIAKYMWESNSEQRALMYKIEEKEAQLNK